MMLNSRDRGNLDSLIELLSRKWHIDIIYVLDGEDSLRFSEIKKRIDSISKKMLSTSLKNLTEQGIIGKEETGSIGLYSLTDKGRKLIEAMEELEEFSKRYEPEHTTVLIVEDEEDQSEMYERWLEDRATVLKARNKSETLEMLEQKPDIVLLDRILGNDRGEDILDLMSSKTGIYSVLVTVVQADFDIIDMPLDDYLIKPVSRADLLEILERRRKNEAKERIERKLQAMLMKKERLLQSKSSKELKGNEKYQELLDNIREMISKLDNA